MSAECLERIDGTWEPPNEFEPEAVVVFVQATGTWLWWARGEMGEEATKEAAIAAADTWLSRLARHGKERAARAEGT